jgi:hypothetical protein
MESFHSPYSQLNLAQKWQRYAEIYGAGYDASVYPPRIWQLGSFVYNATFYFNLWLFIWWFFVLWAFDLFFIIVALKVASSFTGLAKIFLFQAISQHLKIRPLRPLKSIVLPVTIFNKQTSSFRGKLFLARSDVFWYYNNFLLENE